MKGFGARMYRPLNMKLVFIFIISTMLPLLITTYIMARVFIDRNSNDTGILIDNTLISLSQSLSGYLNELDQLTLIPYYNDDFIYALKVMASESYESMSKYQVLSITNMLDSQLRFVRHTRKDIMSTLIVSDNKPLFYSTNNPLNDVVSNYEFFDTSWYRKALLAGGNAVFIKPHKQDYFTRTKNETVFSVARTIREIPSQRPISVIIADANTVVLQKMFQDIDFHVPSHIVLLDHERNIVYANHEVTPALFNPMPENRSIIRDGSSSYMVVRRTVAPYNWELIVLLSYSHLEQKTMWVYLNSALLYIICLVVAFLFYQWLSRKVMGPVKEIIKTMRKVEQGDFSARYHYQTKDEFDVIGRSLNTMVEELKLKIEMEYVLVLKQRNSEYKALQSQIQPHFLFNMLNGFIALNQIGERELLEKSIIDLTVLLRYILNQTDMTTLEEELHLIEKYGSLQQLRFGQRLQVHVSCEDGIRPYKVPKLLLQPLVENAIIHGIEPLNCPCRLTVAADTVLEDGVLFVRIRIEDDGAGFDTTQAEGLGQIGLANTRERLLLCFSDSLFQLASSLGSGTRIVIMIPEANFLENNNSG
ncbi:HAMP domain-containing protein [Paenibacillus sp. LMG 31456]|uniref:HAMP domain-containing protein n=1 Tax=Paenibacillus foliorum TaxID=2654974 RepID=A0A972H1B2_9BACL|nr:sensor histidine kinase [Paenibacillus foliorum]NOU94396.1 HAMP domain-containing protein [Paenibacillus foliorum]